MTDFIAKDDEDRWGADRAECFAATEQRGWDPQGGATRPDPVAACHQPTTATGRWRRFILDCRRSLGAFMGGCHRHYDRGLG
jgi:hypothetical protein